VADGWAEVDVKNKFLVGDQIEVIHPTGNHVLTLEHMQNTNGEPIAAAPGSPLTVRIPLSAQYEGALLARLMPVAATAPVTA
jgi:putative protease